MKLGAKIFFCVTIFFSVAFLSGGYVLLSFFYETTINRERERAIEQYQYNKFVMQANLITKGEEWFSGVEEGKYDISGVPADMNNVVAIFTPDQTELYSGFPAGTDFSSLLEGASDDMVNLRFFQLWDRTYLLVAGMVRQDAAGVYLVTGVDVEQALEQQQRIVGKFGAVYAAATGIAAVLILGMSYWLTRPVKLLTDATKKIADGRKRNRRPGISGTRGCVWRRCRGS